MGHLFAAKPARTTRAPAEWFEKMAEGGPWQMELGHLHIPGELIQLRSTWRSGSGWEAGP